MPRTAAALALAALACLPATTAFAQAVPTHWSAVYTGPILLGGALLVMGIGAVFGAPGWNRLGIFLWLVLVIASGCLAIYSNQGAALGKPWQLPAFTAGLLVFLVAANWALVRLKRA